MKRKAGALPANLQGWVTARKRHRLSHAHVQKLARELGMNPRQAPDRSTTTAKSRGRHRCPSTSNTCPTSASAASGRRSSSSPSRSAPDSSSRRRPSVRRRRLRGLATPASPATRRDLAYDAMPSECVRRPAPRHHGRSPPSIDHYAPLASRVMSNPVCGSPRARDHRYVAIPVTPIAAAATIASVAERKSVRPLTPVTEASVWRSVPATWLREKGSSIGAAVSAAARGRRRGWVSRRATRAGCAGGRSSFWTGRNRPADRWVRV